MTISDIKVGDVYINERKNGIYKIIGIKENIRDSSQNLTKVFKIPAKIFDPAKIFEVSFEKCLISCYDSGNITISLSSIPSFWVYPNTDIEFCIFHSRVTPIDSLIYDKIKKLIYMNVQTVKTLIENGGTNSTKIQEGRLPLKE